MTIARRLAVGYTAISVACLALVAWLGYHEFVEEPAEYAALGMPHLHKETEAELSAVIFLAAVPVLLGLGWWWTRRVLAPLTTLAAAVERIDSGNLHSNLANRGKDNEVDRLTAAFNSMTARLDAAFQRIHEFTLHASHELKTPLAVMRAQLETVLRENGKMAAEEAEWIESQIDELKRMASIVDSLTLLTKADSGLIDLERLPVPLDELVAEAYEDALHLAQPHGLKVSLEAVEKAAVMGDRHRLRQLLLILTDNAVKYNRPGGTILMALRKNDTFAELRISNTSDELSDEMMKSAFGRFVRGQNARGKIDGCGLGLTIAEWITHAHGGTIALHAGNLGETTVTVRIPLLAQAGAIPEAANAPA